MSGIVRANNAGQSGAVSNIETIDSDDYVDVSIDTAHIGNDQVTGAKLNPSLVLGDIIYADGTDTIARLAKGSEDEVLTMGGSNAPTWAAASAGTDISVHVRSSATQSIANNAMTALLFNTDSGAANTYDTDTMHATDSGRLVATTPGKYIIKIGRAHV